MFARIAAAFVFGTTSTGMMSCSNASCADHICHKKTWGVPWVDDWDNPEKNNYPVQSRKVHRHLIFIRHGQYENESHSKLDADHRLTALGKLQAIETGRALSDLLADSSTSELFPTKKLGPIFVSDLQRAKETCALISEQLPPHSEVRVETLLREIFPCDPQPRYAAKKASADSERRVEEAFEKFLHRPTTSESAVELYICHANIIRYFLCRSLQLPPEAWLRFSLPHCSLTHIVVDGRGRVKVTGVGSAGHLPTHMQTIHNVA